MTTAETVLLVSFAMCWAAARVSKLVLFHLFWRCSVMTSIFTVTSLQQFKTAGGTPALPQMTRASNFNFSTSFVAASFGVPVRNSVFFVFVGT